MTDTVEAIVAEMRDAAGDYEQWGRETMEAFADRLQSAHDAEARDARRYRWLRNQANFASRVAPQVCMVDCLRPEDAEPLHGDEVDAAIDRAMEGEDG